MSINFDRNLAQLTFESLLGVSNVQDLASNRVNAETHILTISEANKIKAALDIDAVNLFYNGAVSFSEGIDAVSKKRFSWASVQLYYSLYYFLRSSLAAKGFAMIRIKKMYRLNVQPGEKLFSTGNARYNTTHEGTISHYKDIYEKSDILLSNKIDNQDAYEWMMSLREIVNYRSANFLEPGCLDVWKNISEAIDDGTFLELLKQLEEDKFILCFQEEYAALGIPIKRLQQTIGDLKTKNLLVKFEDARKQHIRSIVSFDRQYYEHVIGEYII